jgi:O-antigen ligase
MAAIGLKVWLFYLPLYALAFAAIRDRTDLWHIMRLLVVVATVPCTIGLAQYALALWFGYAEIMTGIYGELAVEVTQGFTTFQLGPGLLMRIPSTFTFVSQYWGFILAMLVPSYAVWRGDPSGSWRRAGGVILLLVLAAGTLCGSRAAFVFMPLLLGITMLLDRKVPVSAVTVTAVVPVVAIAVVGLGFRSLFEHLSELIGHYGRSIAYDGLVEAVATAPLGAGTGTNTGPARYSLADPSTFQAIENFYAKAAYELGLPGLLLITALFGWIVWSGWRVTKARGDELRPCAAALTAFAICLAVNSFKGWQLDLDPVNVYFWVFAGILCRIGAFDDAKPRCIDGRTRTGRTGERAVPIARGRFSVSLAR